MTKNIKPILLLSLILFSCGSSKYTKLSFSKTDHKTNDFVKIQPESEKKQGKELIPSVNIQFGADDVLASLSSDENLLTVEPNIKKVAIQDGCDVMLLRSGEEISVKVVEIGTQEIKYKKCDNQQGPTISVLKSDVFMITYANGSKDVFKAESKPTTSNNNTTTTNNNSSNTPTKTNGLAVASLVLGLLGFIPILGLIFGLVALGQINNNPRKYTGKGMAVTGIILSILWIVLLILIFL